MKPTKTLLTLSLIAAALALTPLGATAQEPPLSHIADPSVYKLLKENETFRVVLGTWKPGQRDAFHSHPALASYVLTTCDLNNYVPNRDKPHHFKLPQGSGWTQKPIASHSVENIGKSDCQIVIVERK